MIRYYTQEQPHMHEGDKELRQRKKRREDLLKLHFHDLAPEDQLRLLRELIGQMEFNLIKAKSAPSSDSLPPRAQAQSPDPQTRTERLPSQAAASTPASGKIPPEAPPSGSSHPSRASGSRHSRELDESDPLWQEFDREVDEVLHSGGDYHHIHSLRLRDAAERYSSLLKRHGYIKGFPPLEELAREARKAASPTDKSTPEWSGWVAKDQDTLDRPLSHEWAEWLLPGSDEDAEPDDD